MRENTNNWGLNIYKLKNQSAYNGLNIYGCNGPLRGIKDIQELITLIPKSFADEFCKEVSKNIKEEFTIESYISDLNIAGFKCNLIDTIPKNIKFNRSILIDINEQDISNEDLINDCYYIQQSFDNNYVGAIHYYTFCLLRHLYYCNRSYLKMYVDWKSNSPTTPLIDFIFNNFGEDCHSLFSNSYGCKNRVINPNIMSLMYNHFNINNVYFHQDTRHTKSEVFNDFRNIFLNTSPSRSNVEISYNNIRYDVSITPKKDYTYDIVKKTIPLYYTYITMNNISIPTLVENIYIGKKNEKIKDHKNVRILSRHPSHNVFRNNPKLTAGEKVVIRLGSTTESSAVNQINSIASIMQSSNKLLMKNCFAKYGISTPEYYIIDNRGIILDGVTRNVVKNLEYPIVAKHVLGSRNSGNYKLNSEKELVKFISSRKSNINNFIFEKYKNYAKEYRIHVSTQGSFLAWRKVRKLSTPENQRWFFNNQNCNWLSESNSNFDRPTNWDIITKECVKALNSVGLDIGGIDVRVQNNKAGSHPKFSIIEVNSACSQSSITSEHYINEFNKLIDIKDSNKV